MKKYDIRKLLEQKDINNNEPNIYLSCGGRSLGKTYSLNKYLLEEYLQHGKKSMFVYRKRPMMKNCCEDILTEDLREFAFNNMFLTVEKKNGGIFYELGLHEKDKFIGNPFFTTYLGASGYIKINSNTFRDVDYLVLDEFLDEVDTPDSERISCMSIFFSIARGHGKSIRNVKLILCSNKSTEINPYFLKLKVGELNRYGYYKGDGWVMDVPDSRIYLQNELKKVSGIMQLAGDYGNYVVGDSLIDKTAQIIPKKSLFGYSYFATINSPNCIFGLWVNKNSVRCCSSVDKSNKNNFYDSVENSRSDGQPLPDIMRKQCRVWYNTGIVEFQNILIKKSFIDIISKAL